MYNEEIIIPCAKSKDLPRTLNNSLHGAKYFTWERSKWRRLVPRYINKLPVKPLTKANLSLIRYSSRQQDFDNMVMSWKFVIDALVNCGVLIGDSHKVIGQPEYLWQKAKKNEYKIVIKITEIV